MQLSDYFATFNIFNILIFVISFVIFDAIGVNIAYFIKPDKYLRPVYWLWGLGLFVFFWFILHFFIPFNSLYVWISMLFCLLISLPRYILQRGPIPLILSIYKFPYPIFFILIAAKPLFFLLNAPPFYTDEMAYHFYSPAQIFLENRWPFIGANPPSMYHMLPKALETSFVLLFTVTKTYATARLLHFLMVFFSLYGIALYIKKNIGLFPATIYSFLSLYLFAASFLAESTWGYIDAGAAVLVMLFLITVIDLLDKPTRNKTLVVFISFGVAIGIKYTAVAFIGSVIIINLFLGIYIFWKKLLKGKKNIGQINIKGISKETLTLLFLAIIFGGYWYLKNFFISGNPIYPFVFNCWHGWSCQTGGDYFQGWAIPMKIENYITIKDILFQQNNLLFITTILSIIFGFIVYKISRKKIIKLFTVIIPASLITELILSRNTTGFVLRYYYHWALIIPLLLVIPLGIYSIKKKYSSIVKIISILYILLFAFSAGNVSIKNIKRIYEPDFVPGYIRNYAMYRITLADWIDYYSPDMVDFIRWCGEKKPMQKILTVDPDLIWNNYEVRIFIVNCQLFNPIKDYLSQDQDEIVEFLRLNFPTGYLVSKTKCQQKPDLTQLNSKDQDWQKRYKVNQAMICKSRQILNNLYTLGN